MDTESFWIRTNEAIKAANTTQRKLALRCGFSERRIESLSSGNRLPDAFEIAKMARALETPIEYLITGENTSPLAKENALLKEKLENIVKIAQG